MKSINSRRAQLLLGVALLAGIPAGSLLNGTGAYAQNATTGAITGIVKDSSGAAVPGAAVQVKDTATGAVLKVTTNAEGRYSAPLLKPSKYEVTATTTGLTSQPTLVDVLVGQTPNVDLAVAPTSVDATVTVSAQTAELTDTVTPSQITTLTEQQV